MKKLNLRITRPRLTKLRLARWTCKLIIASDSVLLWLSGKEWGDIAGYVSLGVIALTGWIYFDLYLWVMKRTFK